MRSVMICLSLLLPLPLGCAFSVQAPEANAADCGDFLATVGHKPEGLEFLGCEKGLHAQLTVLQARYRVRGTDAAMAEEYFVFHSGMPRLRFACCGWENAHGGYG
ncbi:MAG: DUF4952 domain-containing protein, partial [Candidatus Accumulibacter sp.]|nr:DUF4952 domain-containing protein [Accumulibacter sp.]